MGEVRNGDQKVRKYLFSKIFYGRQAVSYENFFQELFGFEGSKHLLEKFRQVHNLKISDRLLSHAYLCLRFVFFVFCLIFF